MVQFSDHLQQQQNGCLLWQVYSALVKFGWRYIVVYDDIRKRTERIHIIDITWCPVVGDTAGDAHVTWGAAKETQL